MNYTIILERCLSSLLPMFCPSHFKIVYSTIKGSLIYTKTYLLVACIVMLNLFKAIFNSISEQVAENSDRILKFSRYALVMEHIPHLSIYSMVS